MAGLTVVDGDRTVEITATEASGRLFVSLADLERGTGWELRAEGLCRGDVCVPVRDRERVLVGDDVDLVAVAAALQRPLAFEPDPAVVVLGDSPAALAGPAARAPTFVLPDLDGRPVALDDFAGKKRLLVAWASW